MTFERLTGEERAQMANRLRAARFQAGLTMREVATKLAANINSVTQWEQGTLPQAETRARLAALYGVAETTLFAEYEGRVAAARELLRPA
jgi:transcriptional regulator with XRE-family HTH domain